MSDGIIFGPEAVRQITEVVRLVLSQTDPSWQLGTPHGAETRKPIIIGKTDSAVAIEQSVTVSVYTGTPQSPNTYQLQDTGTNIVAISRFGAVPANTMVVCQRFVHGWEIIQSRCGA
jgi:hypothetical protein